MLLSILAVVLVCVLAVVIIVLNRKNTKSYNDLMEKGASAEKRITSLRADIDAGAEKAERTEEKLQRKIEAIDINGRNHSEALYIKAAEYTDQKSEEARSHADELFSSVVSDLENRNDILTSILSSLNEDNKQLRGELAELRKKLNFYANIEEAAENINVTEDTAKREELIEAARQQLLKTRKHEEPSADTHPADHNETAERKKTDSQSEEETAASFPLDHEQSLALEYMESTGRNLFITGKAGTGKSFLLDVFRRSTAKKHVVLAPTGIAALNVKGATLHSTFGFNNLVKLNVDEINEDTLSLKSEKSRVLREVATIIIDEISMVRADTFDKIDRILKVINHSDKPFGGKQMLIFGDLFQLPPVAKKQEYDYLRDRYGGIMFFHSKAYRTGDFRFIELTVNHRQKNDSRYFDILNRIREGRPTDEDISLLNSRYTPQEDVYKDRFISLYPNKADAERVNQEHIDQLKSIEYTYKSKTVYDKYPNQNKNLESVFPCANELKLKLGASVMMVANDMDHRWVNGSLGIVKKLTEDRIYVSFGIDKVYEIEPYEFTEQEVTYRDNRIHYDTILSIKQFPLVPAYAITIHKSQGQTYNEVSCDINRCFASGQAYVALSRCVSLNGLHLKSRITSASIKVDPDVLSFYSDQIKNHSLQQQFQP